MTTASCCRIFKAGRHPQRGSTRLNDWAPEDAYDLVLVILPRIGVREILPMLAANQNTPSVMFFGNNAGGSEGND